MAKNATILILILGFGLMSLAFQNCANPDPYPVDRTANQSSTSPAEPDTTPRITRPGDSLPGNPLGPLPPVSSAVQVSGSGVNERGYAVLETQDNHFVTAGYATNNPETNTGTDVLFKKFDNKGNLVYSVRIGDNYGQQSYKVIELPDCYLVAGFTHTISPGGANRGADLMLVRINKSDGELLEGFQYGSPENEVIIDIIYTSDSNGPSLVAVGYINNDGVKSGLIIKFDMNFDIVWQRRLFQGSHGFTLTSLVYVPAHGYYAAGYRTRSGQNNDSWIVRFSDAGILMQSRILNNLTHEDHLRDVGFDGEDIIAVGRLNGNGRQGEGAIYRFNPSLNPISTWIVGVNNSREQFMDLNTHPDGGLVLAGMIRPNSGDQDNFLIKIKPDRSIEFQKRFGTSADDHNQHHSAILRKDGGYASIMNFANPTNRELMQPVFYLIDQYGSSPRGCIDQSNFSLNLMVQSNNTFEMKAASISVADVNLLTDRLEDFVSTAETPSANQYCPM